MKRSGGQVITEFLKREKVPYVIGIPGHGVLSLFDAIRLADEKGDIKYLQVKHEQAAVHMADGYFRACGRPLATLSSIGPGSLNTGIGLATAYVDSSAVLSLCGDTHTNMMGVGVLQEIERNHDSNFNRAIEPLVKRSWRVENVNQLPRVMNRAFGQMLTGRPGPVMVALPMDVQAADCDTEIPAELPERPENHAAPCKEDIERAVKLMKTARRPVILAGGACLKTKAAEEIKALAERWNAAVVTTLAGKSAFPEDHPLYCWHTGSKGTPIGLEITSKADVILALGTRFADETTCSYREGAAFSFPKTKLIHVDINAEEIDKNYHADVGIVGDLKSTLVALTAAYGKRVPTREKYLAEIAQLKEKWAAEINARRNPGVDGLTISQLIGKMEENLPADTIVCTSSGNTQAQLFQEYCFKTPYSNLTTGGFSTMGWAVPAAMGAKLACRDKPVVALVGDGDFMMTMQELSTMVQYNIPVTVVLANNRGWHAIKDLQIEAFGSDHAFGNDWKQGEDSYSPDFVSIAKAFGMETRYADNPEDAGKAIKELAACGKPAMLVTDVHRDYPYTGAPAYGWWDVPVPAYIPEKKANYEKGKKGEHFTF